jgi:hypothetical protein
MTPAEMLALTERSFAAWSPPDIEAIIALYQPDCEWRMGHIAVAEAMCERRRRECEGGFIHFTV